MIRREIAVGAALASAFFLVGQVMAPAPPVRAPAPAPPHPTELLDEPMEEVDPGVPLFMIWPEKPSMTPTLVWPPAGCDAGMWSVDYEIDEIDAETTSIVANNIDWPDTLTASFEIEHVMGAEVALYPVAPEKAWMTIADPSTGDIVLRRIDGQAQVQCEVQLMGSVSGPQVRANVDEPSGIRLYSLDDWQFAGRAFDDDCELVTERSMDASLVNPVPVELQSAPASSPPESMPFFRHVIEDATATISHGQRYSGLSVLLQTHETIEKFAIEQSDDRLIVVLVAGVHTYVYVLDEELDRLWQKTFENLQPWHDPVTAVALERGVLALKGSLDASPWNAGNEVIRFYDTTTDEFIGEINPPEDEVAEMTWTWPAPTEGSLEECRGGGGMFGSCNGELVTKSYRVETTEGGAFVVAEITRDWGEDPTTCSEAVELDDPDMQVRAANADDGGLAVYAMSEYGLLGWTFDLDCQINATVDLPRSVLTTHPTSVEVATIGQVVHWHWAEAADATARWTHNTLTLYVPEESTHVLMRELALSHEGMPDVVTGLDWDGTFLSARGAFETPPWSVERDFIRVFRRSDGAVVVDARAAAVESNR